MFFFKYTVLKLALFFGTAIWYCCLVCL